MSDDQDKAKIQAVLEAWNQFDLDGRRQKMDNTCLELKSAKETAQSQRKLLAESTKEFRKMTDTEKVVTVKDLIKSYQTEIDTLTKRARASDGAFFALYKDLFEAPDPVEALKLALSARPRAAASELEVQKLKGEVEAYEAEFRELKNQDVTIRKLEEQLEDFEEQLDKRVALKVEECKAELEEGVQRRVDEVLEREAAMGKRLGHSMLQLQEASATADRMQTKLFEVVKQGEDAAAAASAEAQILAELGEKHQSSNASLERENSLLRARLETSQHAHALLNPLSSPSSSSSSRSPPSSPGGCSGCGGGDNGMLEAVDPIVLAAKVRQLESEIAELRGDNSRLQKEVLSRDRLLETATVAHSDATSSLSSQLHEASSKASSAMLDLKSRLTKAEADSLRHQLRQLQRLEFNVEEDGDDSDDGEKEGGGGAAAAGKKGVGKAKRKHVRGTDSPTTTTVSSGVVDGGEGEDASLSSALVEAEDVGNPNPEESTSTMERLLMVRLRRVENKEVTLRRQVEESEAQLVKSQQEKASSLVEVQRLTELVKSLEHDLKRVFQAQGNGTSAPPPLGGGGGSAGGSAAGGKGAGTSAGAGNEEAGSSSSSSGDFSRDHEEEDEALSALLGGSDDSSGGVSSSSSRAATTAAVSTAATPETSAASGAAALPQAQSAAAPTDMLSIVVAQRDRFMKRISELEREKAVLSRQASSSQGSGQQLQRDNLKLYEKIRYLQSYGGGGRGALQGSDTGGGGGGCGMRSGGGIDRAGASAGTLLQLEDGGFGVGGGGGGGGSDGNMEGRYRSLYEQQTNPFTQFSLQERQRKYAELSVAEKITLNTTRMFLSSKFARTFAFFYVVTLHVLVFVTILHWSHSNATSCPLPVVSHAPLSHMHGAPPQALAAVAPVAVAVPPGP